MTPFALALLLSLSAQAAAPKAALPVGLRCESVKKSSILDLGAFCKGPLDKRRLVDYGYQLDILESCGEAALSKSLKIALQAKVHRADEVTCAEIAEGLAEDLRLEK
jgi:hypothetical protein